MNKLLKTYNDLLINFRSEIDIQGDDISGYKKKIYVYGIALTSDEKDEVIREASEILDVKDIIASIILVEDLRIQKN